MSAALRIQLMLLLRRNHSSQGVSGIPVERAAAKSVRKATMPEEPRDGFLVDGDIVNGIDEPATKETVLIETRDPAKETSMKLPRVFALVIAFGVLSICSSPAHAQQEVDPDHFDQPQTFVTYAQAASSRHLKNPTVVQGRSNKELTGAHSGKRHRNLPLDVGQRGRSGRTNHVLPPCVP